MDQYCQSVSENGKLIFKVSAVFEEDTLDLTVFSPNSAWKVNVSHNELLKQSESHNTNFDEYYTNLKKYFECRPNDVDFEFKAGEFRINLLLKNKMNILYFCCSLTKENFTDNIFNLLDFLYLQKAEYFKELTNVKDQYNVFKNDYKVLEDKFNDFLERRAVEEKNTYNKYLAVLNEKKRQIQHLNDILSALRKGRPTYNPPVQIKRKNAKETAIKRSKTPESSSESVSDVDADYNTDNAERDDEAHRQSNNLSPTPSTSKDIKPEPLSASPPQSFTFLKRLRRDNSEKLAIIVPKTEPVENKCIQEASKDLSQPKDPGITTVDFSTQDLLDNL